MVRRMLLHSIFIMKNSTVNISLKIIFIVAPCMLIVLSPLFVQLMHTNYYKIVKQLKSFKIITVAPTCFGIHKPSSGSSQPALCQNYDVDIGYISLFEVAYAVTIPITSNNGV